MRCQRCAERKSRITKLAFLGTIFFISVAVLSPILALRMLDIVEKGVVLLASPFRESVAVQHLKLDASAPRTGDSRRPPEKETR